MKYKYLAPIIAIVGTACIIVFLYFRPLLAIFNYDKKSGDLLFQSLAPNQIANMIEGSTGSRYSHCGILVLEDNNWYVLEAIGPVKLTNYWTWINRGYEKRFDAYRINEISGKELQFINAAKVYIGKKYDHKYKMDDNEIYCSELLYKAFLDSFHHTIGKIEHLGDLNWKPYTKLIETIEGGPVPIDREMITPKSISESKELTMVYNSLKN